jgi:hypothetical protein
MKSKNYSIFILIFLSLNMIVISSVGAETETISTMSEKDSYVSASNPTLNYGGQMWIMIGYYITNFTEAYYYFNFSDKPSDWQSAEIQLHFYSVPATWKASAFIINDTWGETTITWQNKPTHRELIKNFTVASAKVYSIDVSSYITGSGISICVNASDALQSTYAQTAAKEGAMAPIYYGPALVWTHPAPPAISSYNVFFIIGAISLTAVSIIIKKRREF